MEMCHSDSGVAAGSSSPPVPDTKNNRITLHCKLFYDYYRADSSVGIYLALLKTAKFRNVKQPNYRMGENTWVKMLFARSSTVY